MAVRAQHDITLTVDEEDVQLKLSVYRRESSAGAKRANPMTIAPQPLREGEQFYRQEQRALYNDASGGAGYGERVAENVYHQGLPVDARMPGIILPPGALTELDMTAVPMTGPVYAFATAYTDGGQHTFFVGNRYCGRIPFGSGVPDISFDLGSAFTGQSIVDWYGNLIVGGTGAPIWRLNTTSSLWSQSSDVWRQYLETVQWERGGQNLPRLVGSTVDGAPGANWGDHSIEYTDNADPMTEAVWSEEIYVGNTGHSITAVVASNRHVYYLKSNGLYDMDDRLYSPNITEYRKHITDILNPMPAWVHNGKIYFGSRTGLDQVPIDQGGVRQDNPRRCEFGFGVPNYGQIRGIPTAGAPAGDGGMWVAIWNPTTTTTYLCWAMDWNDVRGVAAPAMRGPLLWHGAFAVLPGVQILSMHMTAPQGASYAPRLYLGGYRVSTGLATIHWLSLPQAGSPYQDLLQSGPMRFADTMVIDFPRETFGNDVSRKDLTRVSIRGDNLGTATLSAYAEYNGDLFGDTLPEALGQATDEYNEFTVTTPTDVRDLAFRVRGLGTSTVPPILRALEAQAGVSVEANTVHTYTCIVGEPGDKADPFVIETQVLAIRGKRGTLIDHRRNREHEGRVLQDVSAVWEEYPSGVKTGRLLVTIPFLVSDRAWYVDTGRSFDAGLRLD